MYKIDKPSRSSFVAKHSFISRQKDVLDAVCERFGRNPDKVCMKVFYANPLKDGETLRDALWGDNPRKIGDPRLNTKLFDGTRIQNICWKHDISPRVYAIFEVSYEGLRVACQLTDYLTGIPAQDMGQVTHAFNHVKRIGKEYHFKSVKDIYNRHDVIEGKVVDLQPFAFDATHIDIVRDLYCNKGRYGKKYYQDVSELGLTGGPRKSKDRVEYLALDKIDFKDKIVWDIGCAGGFFCRYAASKGAKRVTGIDFAEPTEAAFHLGNFVGEFNIDYIAHDLRKGLPQELQNITPDIVFFLSMNFHIGTPAWIYKAKTIIFEDNGRESRKESELGISWKSQYKNIVFIGRAKDHGDKAIYHAMRR